MSFFDPFSTSEKLARLWARALKAEGQLDRGVFVETPFLSDDFPGESLRREILGLADYDPLRGPLLVWCDTLLELRINFEALRQESLEFHGELHPPVPPLPEPLSLAHMERAFIRAAVDPSGADEARSVLRGLIKSGQRLSAVRRERFARLLEIEHRLGGPLSPWLSLQCGEPAAGASREGGLLVEVVARAEGNLASEEHVSAHQHVESQSGAADATAKPSAMTIPLLAERVLALTQEPYGSLAEEGWLGLVRSRWAVGATDGWPGRLARDVLLDLLGGDWLVHGVQLPPVHLPERLAPGSYLLAVEQLARSVAWATGPQDLPFVVAHHPAALRGRELGATLVSWMTTAPFVRKRLDLVGDDARHALRALWLSSCANLRMLAMQALCLNAARESSARLDATYEELTERLSGEHLGAPLGVLRVPLGSDAEFCAALLGLARLARLRDAHDEDFVDNPRAREQIRAELKAVPTGRVDLAELEAGLVELLSRAPRS